MKASHTNSWQLRRDDTRILTWEEEEEDDTKFDLTENIFCLTRGVIDADRRLKPHVGVGRGEGAWSGGRGRGEAAPDELTRLFSVEEGKKRSKLASQKPRRKFLTARA